MTESGGNSDQKALKNYYDSYFAEADLILVKPGIYQMPIEKVGSDLLQIFKENFKIFRKFLTKLFTFSYPPEFFRDISKDIIDIDQNFAKVKSFIDLKKALTGLRKKWHDTPTMKSGGQSAWYTNLQAEQIDLHSNSQLGADLFGANQENIPKLGNESFQSTTMKLSPIKSKSDAPTAESFKKCKNENTSPEDDVTGELEDKFNELMCFKQHSDQPTHESNSVTTNTNKRATSNEINKWKNALHVKSTNNQQ